MEPITLHNYEAFLLDYFEGNLRPEAIMALKAFMVLHPELEVDLNPTDLPKLMSDSIEASFKNELKKEPEEELLNYFENQLFGSDKLNFEGKLKRDLVLRKQLLALQKTKLQPDKDVLLNYSFLLKTEEDVLLNNETLLYFEKQLNETDALTFENKLQQSEILAAELQGYTKTKLIADKAIVFEDKAALKKETKILRLFSVAHLYRMAASLLLFFSSYAVYLYFSSEASNVSESTRVKLNTHVIYDKGTLLKKNSMDPIPHSSITSNSNTSSLKSSTASVNLVAVTTSTTLLANKNTSQDVILTNSVARNEFNTIKDTNLVLNQAKETLANKANLKEEQAVKEVNITQEALTQVGEKKINNILLSEEDDEEVEPNGKKISGFWKRALYVAKQAKHLGVKSIEAEEKSNSTFFLAFNSFSVEKK